MTKFFPAAVRAARRLWRDQSGQFAILMAIGLVVVFGALALAVDYAEMSRRRKEMQSTLDAAALATGREMIKVSDPAKLNIYASDFFQQNLPTMSKQDFVLTLTLPKKGGEPVRLCAKYRPTMPAVNLLLSRLDEVYEISTCSAVATRNTLEVALVLDNSGSMTSIATGTGKTRMDLLKGAATQLVDLLGGAADGLTQVDKAVQFAVVPFNQLVNVGAGHSGDKWMDQNGLSPVQNESFDWSAIRDGGLGAKKRVEFRNGTWVRKGTDWGTDDGKAITRFDLFSKVLKLPWAGCVEGRPYPYNVNDDAPILNKPETFFVPMFAIAARRLLDWEIIKNYNWTNEYLYRADAYRYPIVQPGTMIDYFQAAYASNSTLTGPNFSCTIAPIRPLTDATTVAGRTALKTAINAMSATRGTNVPEGLAWGWRMLSHGEPFTEGRPDEELGNDKVVIVLTDGANLYQPGNRSAYGYADQPSPPRTGYPRLFQGHQARPQRSDGCQHYGRDEPALRGAVQKRQASAVVGRQALQRHRHDGGARSRLPGGRREGPDQASGRLRLEFSHRSQAQNVLERHGGNA